MEKYYKNKYLKYKNKYINLKGGSIILHNNDTKNNDIKESNIKKSDIKDTNIKESNIKDTNIKESDIKDTDITYVITQIKNYSNQLQYNNSFENANNNNIIINEIYNIRYVYKLFIYIIFSTSII